MRWKKWWAIVLLVHSLVSSPEAYWKVMLSGFDQIRAEAIEDGRPGLLDSIYVTGSSLIDEDRSLIKIYQRRHVTIERMETDVLSVRVDRVSAKRVRLAVVDHLEPTR